MSLPEIVTHEEWVHARTRMLAKEKELTRQRDALCADRRRLPMVRIEKDYRFEGPEGEVALLDLFDGRRQLMVSHFMFDPRWDDGCPSCSAGADEVSDGLLDHLHTRDTTLAFVSRAPYPKIADYKARKGWTFPWYSSFGTDFNYDFDVTLDSSRKPVVYNFATKAEHQAKGNGAFFDGDEPIEAPGLSCFLRLNGESFHTYSQYARGAEQTGGSYYFLDLTALGRQEEWEEPKGRAESVRGARPDFAT